jgi:hypothetical protein
MIKPEQAKSFLFTTAIRLSLNLIKHDKVVLNFELQSKSNGTPRIARVPCWKANSKSDSKKPSATCPKNSVPCF